MVEQEHVDFRLVEITMVIAFLVEIPLLFLVERNRSCAFPPRQFFILPMSYQLTP